MELLQVWITAKTEIFVRLTVFSTIKIDLVYMQRKYEESKKVLYCKIFITEEVWVREKKM